MISEGHLVCDDCHGKRFVRPSDLVAASLKGVADKFVDKVLADSDKKLVELLVADALGCQCEFEWTDDGVLNVRPIVIVERISLTLKFGERVEVSAC